MCKTCENGATIIDAKDIYCYIQSSDEGHYYLDVTYTGNYENGCAWGEINYCPMCGRNLSDQPQVDINSLVEKLKAEIIYNDKRTEEFIGYDHNKCTGYQHENDALRWVLSLLQPKEGE